jgi:hypothetical protein
VAAFGKAIDPSARSALAATLRQGLRLPLAGAVARTLPVVEAATVLLLAIPGTRSVGLVAAVAVFGVLACGAGVLAARATTYRCACFGASAAPITWWTAARAAAFGLVAAGALVAHEQVRLGVPASLAGFLTCGVAAALVCRRVDLAELLRPGPHAGAGRVRGAGRAQTAAGLTDPGGAR